MPGVTKDIGITGRAGTSEFSGLTEFSGTSGERPSDTESAGKILLETGDGILLENGTDFLILQ